MKCPSCGSPMGLENKFCPYCGEPNKLAIKHQMDMDHFEAEYQGTKERVFNRTELLRRHGGNLIVMVLVLVALIIAIILNFYAWEIGYNIRGKQASKYRELDRLVIQEYLDEGEYGKFRGYYDTNDMDFRYDDEYWVVSRVALAYSRLFGHVSSVKNPSSYFDASSLEYAAEDLHSIFNIEKEYERDKEKYLTEDKMVYIRDMQERATLIAKTYFGLTDEHMQDISNMSKTKLASLMEEGLSK